MSMVEPVMGEQGWEFATPGADRRHASTASSACTRSICSADPHYTGRVIGAGAVGQGARAPSSTTSRRRSSACSIRRSTRSPTTAPTTIRPSCAARSTRSTRCVYDERQQRRLSRRLRHARRRPTRKRSAICSPRSTSSKSGCRASAISPATRITEADWRLFTTLVRFDAVYYGHFKCNLRRIADYPNLSNYLRDLYQVPGVAETVNMDHIKRHYYMSMPHHQSDRHRAARARRSISRRSMIGGGFASALRSERASQCSFPSPDCRKGFEFVRSRAGGGRSAPNPSRPGFAGHLRMTETTPP